MNTIKQFTKALECAVFLAILGSCNNLDYRDTQSGNQARRVMGIVLTNGQTVEAITASGTIRIDAGANLKRSYTWDGETRTVRLYPRQYEWRGLTGAYSKGAANWRSNHGVTRGALQESVINFQSKTEAMAWIERPWHISSGAIYRNDGLFVLFAKTPSRKQINVDLLQITIGNRKPTSLPGAKDRLISRITR